MTRGATSAGGSGAGSPCVASAMRTACGALLAAARPGSGALLALRADAARRGAPHHLPGAILDALDEVGQHAVAAVGEHRVAGGDIQRRHLHRAERERQIVRQRLRIETEAR